VLQVFLSLYPLFLHREDLFPFLLRSSRSIPSTTVASEAVLELLALRQEILK